MGPDKRPGLTSSPASSRNIKKSLKPASPTSAGRPRRNIRVNCTTKRHAARHDGHPADRVRHFAEITYVIFGKVTCRAHLYPTGAPFPADEDRLHRLSIGTGIDQDGGRPLRPLEVETRNFQRAPQPRSLPACRCTSYMRPIVKERFQLDKPTRTRCSTRSGHRQPIHPPLDQSPSATIRENGQSALEGRRVRREQQSHLIGGIIFPEAPTAT